MFNIQIYDFTDAFSLDITYTLFDHSNQMSVYLTYNLTPGNCDNNKTFCDPVMFK